MALVSAKIPKVQPAEPSIRAAASRTFVPTEVARTSEAKQARLAQGLDGGFIQTVEIF